MSQADRAQYASAVTSLSEQELRSVFEVAIPPICLLGGWAVHLHVNEAFEAARGQPYIGSRDIDIGVHIDPTWDAETLAQRPVGQTYAKIRDELCYTPSRFGFAQQFHRESGERLDDDEAQTYAQHELFPVYIDMLSSTPELDDFHDAFGFRPPDEPLLAHVFGGSASESLSKYTSWAPTDAKIVTAPVLAAMKVRALPERDKGHKRLKDVADLHALLWYSEDYQTTVSRTSEYLDSEDRDRFERSVSTGLYQRASALINEQEDTLTQSISQFVARLSR